MHSCAYLEQMEEKESREEEEEELTEEERKAAWAEYEAEKKVVHLKCFLVFVFMLLI